MKLKTEQLKNFQKKTVSIQSNGILPILSYLKVSKNSISKSNLQTTCVMKIDADTDKEFLLEEKTLYALVGNTSAGEIDIKLNGKNIILFDGKTTVTHSIEAATNFPAIQSIPESDPIKIEQDILDEMIIATSFVGSTENQFGCIHIKNDYVAATDSFKMYHKKFKQKLPNIILHPDEVSMIAKLKEVSLYDSAKTYFIHSDNTTYSFLKYEYVTPDFETLIKRFAAEGVNFTLDKYELISFCDLANNITESKIATCTLSKTGLNLNDEVYGKTLNKDIAGLPDISFTFNSKIIAAPLKTIDADILKCTLVHNALLIRDIGVTACFMGIVNQVN